MSNSADPLSELLKRLTAAAPSDAPARIQSDLKTAFRYRRARIKRLRIVGFAGLAACFSFAIALFIWMHSSRANPQMDTAVAPVSSNLLQKGFIPLPSFDPDVPMGNLIVVHMELPRAGMMSLGLPVPTDDWEHHVMADVLVGEDGTPYAVRLQN